MPLHPLTEGASNTECPICWSITERNIQRMCAGESIVLCTWRELVTFSIKLTDEATGLEQGACPLCASITAHIIKIEGGATYIDEATFSMFIEPEERGSKYLKRLGLRISQKRDLWKDPAHRTEYVAADPSRYAKYKGWEQTREYTFHMAFCTNGGPTEQYVQQRMADPEILSDKVFDEIRNWSNQCLIEHEGCPRMEFKALPTRVLDIGRSTNTPIVETIKIIETGDFTASTKAVYAALSYCWGPKPQEVLLTNATMAKLKVGIAVQELPLTLRHSILVTRQLGLQYLWIDALCIIQDSPDDKAKELAQMPHIYKNAIITISAAIAETCHQGFLHDRPEIEARIKALFCLPLIWDVLQPDGERASEIFLSADDTRGFQIKDFEDEIIESRAWTFQEAWLAPRLLVFGSGPVQWRCLSSMKTQAVEEQIVKPGKTDLVKRVRMPQYQEREKFFLEPFKAMTALFNERLKIPAHDTTFPSWLENWMVIAAHYSRREITFNSDRLPALSAIASEYGRMYGDQYLAGLWKSSLPWSLLWHCTPDKPAEGPMNTFKNTTADEQEQEHRRGREHLQRLTMEQILDLATKYTKSVSAEHFQKRPNRQVQQGQSGVKNSCSPPKNEEYIAPTWSFASVDTGIIFASHEWDGPHASLLEIHSAETTPLHALTPFSAVTSGSITLTGPLQPLSRDEILSFYVLVPQNTRPHIFWDYIIPDASPLGREALGPLLEAQKGEEMAAFNSQLGIGEKEKVLRKMLRDRDILPEMEPRNPKGAPRKGVSMPPPLPPRNGASSSTQAAEFFFLEVTWTRTPRGLVLVRKGRDSATGLDKFARVGYFCMGRNEYEKTDWRTRGAWNAGERNWDWEDFEIASIANATPRLRRLKTRYQPKSSPESYVITRHTVGIGGIIRENLKLRKEKQLKESRLYIHEGL
ncbi:heterokaryon incompatibility protein-domain-containing protein [Bisporella sp. PMI_857]|nr:heterokaryon incompatibility protein-domain-containing protein [Bisporella sp. PMI_857]